MVLETMIQICKAYKKAVILTFFILFSFNLFSEKNWIIGAEQFVSTRGKQTSVTDGITRMFPSRILEKLSTNLYRNVSEDEELYSKINSLKTERTSLFLQMSSEIKKRDSFVTGNYSEKELKKKIEEQSKKIAEIQNKIDENLKKQGEIESQLSYNPSVEAQSDTKNNKMVQFFSSFFKTEETKKQELEKVVLYKKDFQQLFVPSDLAKQTGYESILYEKDVIKEGINGLITGKIALYGDYFSLTCQLYVYPGAKVTATVTEVGSLSEAELVSSLIARELAPAISNSLPVQLKINIQPESIKNEVLIYMDSQLIKGGTDGFTTDSGVHVIQFLHDGYDSITTSYSFEGDRTYKVDVNLKPSITKEIKLQLPPNVMGNVYISGEPHPTDEEYRSTISINNKQILGIFIAEDNSRAFMVIPEGSINKGEVLNLNVKAFDRTQYIEKHRTRMYNSYSALMTSLIPMFFTMGQANAYRIAEANGYLSSNDMAKLQGWNIASGVSIGLTVGCGGWFVYELINYFRAVNTVLPTEAK